jgi:hypothetical protein
MVEGRCPMRNRVADGEHVRVTRHEEVPRVRVDGLATAWRRSSRFVPLFLVILIVVYWWFVMAVESSPGDWAFDFRQFWQGGNDVVEGLSPYPSAELLATAGGHLDPEGIRDVFRFPYPAGAAIAFAPFGALSFETAAAVWSALLILSLFAALLVLGVRDWRVLAVVVSSAPVIGSVRLGTLTPLLVLLLAMTWRWRDSRWLAGGALALAISLKLFVWPVVVWLLATKRYAAAATATVAAAVATLAAWALIGFEGLAEYPGLVRRLSDVVGDRGYSFVALGVEVGLPRALAGALPWVVGVAVLASLVANARRDGGDRVTFSLAVVGALAMTPIVWLHYFALLVVPLALAWPRFGWPWALLWLFWLTPVQENGGDIWRILLAIAVTLLVIAWVSRRSHPPTMDRL